MVQANFTHICMDWLGIVSCQFAAVHSNQITTPERRIKLKRRTGYISFAPSSGKKHPKEDSLVNDGGISRGRIYSGHNPPLSRDARMCRTILYWKWRRHIQLRQCGVRLWRKPVNNCSIFRFIKHVSIATFVYLASPLNCVYQSTRKLHFHTALMSPESANLHLQLNYCGPRLQYWHYCYVSCPSYVLHGNNTRPSHNPEISSTLHGYT